MKEEKNIAVHDSVREIYDTIYEIFKSCGGISPPEKIVLEVLIIIIPIIFLIMDFFQFKFSFIILFFYLFFYISTIGLQIHN